MDGHGEGAWRVQAPGRRDRTAAVGAHRVRRSPEDAPVRPALLRRPSAWLSPSPGPWKRMEMTESVVRRMRVNPTLCTGYGYCAEIVPELIGVDDWGYPIVSSRPIEDDELLKLARRAVATCPRLALVVEESVAGRER